MLALVGLPRHTVDGYLSMSEVGCSLPAPRPHVHSSKMVRSLNCIEPWGLSVQRSKGTLVDVAIQRFLLARSFQIFSKVSLLFSFCQRIQRLLQPASWNRCILKYCPWHEQTNFQFTRASRWPFFLELSKISLEVQCSPISEQNSTRQAFALGASPVLHPEEWPFHVAELPPVPSVLRPQVTIVIVQNSSYSSYTFLLFLLPVWFCNLQGSLCSRWNENATLSNNVDIHCQIFNYSSLSYSILPHHTKIHQDHTKSWHLAPSHRRAHIVSSCIILYQGIS